MIWEYAVSSVNATPEQLTERFGINGWEMVAVDNPLIYFKRPIPEPEPLVSGVALQKNYSPKKYE